MFGRGLVSSSYSLLLLTCPCQSILFPFSFLIIFALLVFRMLTIRSSAGVALLGLLSAFVGDVAAVPQNRKGGNRGGGQTQQTLQQQAAEIPQGVSQATDGSTILDMTATVKYVNLLGVASLFRNAFGGKANHGLTLSFFLSAVVLTSASRSPPRPTSSSLVRASRARRRRLAIKAPTESTSCYTAMAASRSLTSRTRLCREDSWASLYWLLVSSFCGA